MDAFKLTHVLSDLRKKTCFNWDGIIDLGEIRDFKKNDSKATIRATVNLKATLQSVPDGTPEEGEQQKYKPVFMFILSDGSPQTFSISLNFLTALHDVDVELVTKTLQGFGETIFRVIDNTIHTFKEAVSKKDRLKKEKKEAKKARKDRSKK